MFASKGIHLFQLTKKRLVGAAVAAMLVGGVGVALVLRPIDKNMSSGSSLCIGVPLVRVVRFTRLVNERRDRHAARSIDDATAVT